MYLVKLNGVYDILCAIAILDIWRFSGTAISVLQNLHLSMFLLPVNDRPNELCKRMIAYWIFTYGIIRVFSSEPRVIAYSYYVEAMFIANESLVKKTMHTDKAYFVIWCSILLGYIAEAGSN
jgi:hypothetical protein